MKKKKKAKKSSKKRALKKRPLKKKAKRKLAKKSVSRFKKKSKAKKTPARAKKIKGAKPPQKKVFPLKAMTKKSVPLAAAPIPEQSYVTQTQRPLPGGFEVERTEVTQGENRFQVKREKFSTQEEMNFDESPLDEEFESPADDEGLLDEIDNDDDDLTPPDR